MHDNSERDGVALRAALDSALRARKLINRLAQGPGAGATRAAAHHALSALVAELITKASRAGVLVVLLALLATDAGARSINGTARGVRNARREAVRGVDRPARPARDSWDAPRRRSPTTRPYRAPRTRANPPGW